MKKTILILTLVIKSAIGFTQTDSNSGNKFELKGKIINEISLPPGCGYNVWGTVIEFEIITFSKPEYKSDTIGVVFTCPESYGDNFFQVGKTYIINVIENNQSNFNWNIPNESILKKYELEKKLIVYKAEKKE